MSKKVLQYFDKELQMEKARRIGDQLVFGNGNILNDEIGTKDPSKKYFAIVTMCGHVGDGYFIPILWPVSAKDEESAKMLVRNSPRVKNQIKDCILGIREISQIEDAFLRAINLHDSYITYSRCKAYMFPRKIVTPSSVQRERERLRNKPRNKGMDLDTPDFDIRFAEDYSETLILQRYFAPRKQGEQIVFPRHVDMDFLLRDYFVERTKALGLNREILPILTCYYKLFGPNNQLGVAIEDNKVSFVRNDGKKRDLDLDNFSLELMDMDGSRLANALKSKTQSSKENFDKLEGSARTGLERFNERWQKTKTLQVGKGKE